MSSEQRPTGSAVQPRRAKHLMDPTQPRQVASAADLARLQRVQRTVVSVLVGTTIFHLSIGLVIAGVAIDPTQGAARVGLCLLAGAFGVLALVAAFVIHGRSPLSPWLLLGLAPTAVGLIWVLR